MPGSTLAPGEVAFSTSGQSGEPVVWLRTEQQLRSEAALLAETVIGPIDRVVNFAPPRHLYGRLLGEVLPAQLGIPVQQAWLTPLTVPELRPEERTLLVCLPSTWLMLRSIVDRLRSLPSVVAVHSTGPATDTTREVVRSLQGSGFRAAEILGSTETGAVAHRALAPRPSRPSLWQLFDDTTLVAGPHPTGSRPAGEQQLVVSSPRLARRAGTDPQPDTLTLDDLVRPVGERRFELLGRSTRMIKINGRRIRLEHVESSLLATFPQLDVVCLPRRDAVRAEHYDLYYADESGTVTNDHVQNLLLATFPGVPLPRLVRRVRDIPRSALGKVRVDRLLAAVSATPAPASASAPVRVLREAVGRAI